VTCIPTPGGTGSTCQVCCGNVNDCVAALGGRTSDWACSADSQHCGAGTICAQGTGSPKCCKPR
jgi:hypothetical protein